MEIKQISVFLENKTGRLGEVTKVLAKAKINIRAISIADTADFGILRLIVDDHDKAAAALTKEKFTVRLTDVVALEIDDKPGALAEIMGLFETSKVGIGYLYASLQSTSGKAVVIFFMEDHKKGLELIKKNKLKMIEAF